MTVAETERVATSAEYAFSRMASRRGGEIALTLDGRSARIAVNWLTGEPRLEPMSRRASIRVPRISAPGVMVERGFALLEILVAVCHSGTGPWRDIDSACSRDALRQSYADQSQVALARGPVASRSGRDRREARARISRRTSKECTVAANGHGHSIAARIRPNRKATSRARRQRLPQRFSGSRSRYGRGWHCRQACRLETRSGGQAMKMTN